MTPTDPADVDLPPLPQACDITPVSWSNLFSVDQMQAYARQAVLAERERCAKLCEEWPTWNMDDPGETAAAAIRGEQK